MVPFLGMSLAGTAATVAAVTAMVVGAGPNTREYHLNVRAQPGTAIVLRASGARGWTETFCTSRTCSIGHTTVAIPANGAAVVKFDVYRVDESAPRTAAVTIFEQTEPALRMTVTIP